MPGLRPAYWLRRFPVARQLMHAAAIASIEQRQTKLPFEIGFGLSTHEDSGGVDADLMIRIRNVGSVAHQPADFRELAARKCHGDRVARRQVDQSGTPID